MPYMTENMLCQLLAKRFEREDWVFLPQVRNGTGFARRARTADAIVMNTYPSRGLHLQGFEIKINRGDWLRELKDPAKAESIARFCDYWWIVTSDKQIALAEELPAPWGLLVANEKATKFEIVKPAEKLAAQPIDRLMLGSLLRSAIEGKVNRASVAPQIEAALKAGRADGEAVNASAVKIAQDNLTKLTATVNKFEEESGLRISAPWGRPASGSTVRVLQRVLDDQEFLDGGLGHSIETVEKLLANLRWLGEEIRKVRLLPVQCTDTSAPRATPPSDAGSRTPCDPIEDGRMGSAPSAATHDEGAGPR